MASLKWPAKPLFREERPRHHILRCCCYASFIPRVQTAPFRARRMRVSENLYEYLVEEHKYLRRLHATTPPLAITNKIKR